MKKRCAAPIIFITVGVLLATLFIHGEVRAAGDYETWSDYGYGVRSQLDRIVADGTDIAQGSAGDYLARNQFTVYGRYDLLVFEGWAGYDMPMIGAGYTVNDGENIFEGQLSEAAAESQAAIYGGDNAGYYSIAVPVSEFKEKVKITLLAKLEDDTAVALNRYDIYFQEKRPQAVTKDVVLTTGGTGAPICFSDYGTVGFRFKVEEGWRLGQFIVVNSPTWDMEGAGLVARIYKWDKDYGTTVKGKCVDTCTIEDHINCTSMIISFYYIPAGEYLIELSDFELKIGGYEATDVAASQKDAFGFFIDGDAADANPPQLKLLLEDDAVPPEVTPAPTEKPTAEPADATASSEQSPEPTENAAVPGTSAPEATSGQASEPSEKSSGIDPGVLIGIIGGVAAIIAIAVAVILASKLKKSK